MSEFSFPLDEPFSCDVQLDESDNVVITINNVVLRMHVERFLDSVAEIDYFVDSPLFEKVHMQRLNAWHDTID